MGVRARERGGVGKLCIIFGCKKGEVCRRVGGRVWKIVVLGWGG